VGVAGVVAVQSPAVTLLTLLTLVARPTGTPLAAVVLLVLALPEPQARPALVLHTAAQAAAAVALIPLEQPTPGV
jgi:hypothetical protein